MMKIIVHLLLITLFIISSCKKSKIPVIPSPPVDPRDAFVGVYSGIRIENYWTGVAGPNFNNDTTIVTFNLTKSITNSENVNLSFDNENYEFRFIQNSFSDNATYQPAILRKSNDSLYFYHQASLAPRSTSCKVKKRP